MNVWVLGKGNTSPMEWRLRTSRGGVVVYVVYSWCSKDANLEWLWINRAYWLKVVNSRIGQVWRHQKNTIIWYRESHPVKGVNHILGSSLGMHICCNEQRQRRFTVAAVSGFCWFCVPMANRVINSCDRESAAYDWYFASFLMLVPWSIMVTRVRSDGGTDLFWQLSAKLPSNVGQSLVNISRRIISATQDISTVSLSPSSWLVFLIDLPAIPLLANKTSRPSPWASNYNSGMYRSILFLNRVAWMFDDASCSNWCSLDVYSLVNYESWNTGVASSLSKTSYM
jgi:hypothetical protein